MNSIFAEEALNKFCGCDGDEKQAGSRLAPSIWLFGIEHGTYMSEHDVGANNVAHVPDEDYTVDTQMRWPYNRKAFKLLAAMDTAYGVDKYLDFANRFRPFVKGSPGFFKGNLYPFPCNSVKDWPQRAVEVTGFNSKQEYMEWCKQNRLPVIRRWVEEYCPKVVIGVGTSARNEFARSIYGDKAPLEESSFSVNGHRKRVFHRIEDTKKLVVVPHFSGPHGLNSNESIRKAGELITKLISQY